MLDSLGPDDFALKLKNLLAFKCVSDGSVVKRALNPIVGKLFSHLYGFAKLGILQLPAINCYKMHVEELRDLKVRPALLVQQLCLARIVRFVSRWTPRFLWGAFCLASAFALWGLRLGRLSLTLLLAHGAE